MRLVTAQGIVWLSYKAIRIADLNQVSRVINTDRFRSKIKVCFDLTLLMLILWRYIIKANWNSSLIYQELGKAMISEIWGRKLK